MHARLSAASTTTPRRLRIVTRLERRYAGFDGLNLSWETLEGLVKHNGPLLDADGKPTERYAATGIPPAIVEYQERQDLWLDSHASAEAQAAALADDIAYNAHDIDDGLRAGLFELADLRALPFLAELLDEIERPASRAGEAARHQRAGAARHHPLRRGRDRRNRRRGWRRWRRPMPMRSARAGEPVIAFSEAIATADREIKAFLYPNMYRHPRDRGDSAPGRRMWCATCSRASCAEPRRHAGGLGRGLRRARRGSGKARRIADYIAGMTDWYALDEHRRLFDATPSLR